MKNIEEIRNYCLNCINKPCSNRGCPLGNDIPAFIHERNPKKAFEIISRTTLLPAICGRVCPHSKQCQGFCIRGIKGEPVKIGDAEAYIGDISLKENYKIPRLDLNELIKKENEEASHYKKRDDEFIKQKTMDKIDYNSFNEGKCMLKVAVIGSGPCGLTCAGFLARYGAKVTIYEKYEKLGGLLRHGIPDFRLDRKIVDKTIEKILDLGIKVETGRELGKNIKNLQKEFDVIFISIGANMSNETLKGENVIKGNEFLEHLNVLSEQGKNKNGKESENVEEKIKIDKYSSEIYGKYKDKNIAISGGGNVAMDCARTFIRMGANVTIVYRRDEEQMPAEEHEIRKAKEEGVRFLVKSNIKSFDSENKKLHCIKTELVKKEGNNRLSPVDIEGTDFALNFDYVVLATGSKPESELLKNEGFELNRWGYIKTNEKFQTSVKNIYAGGDVAGSKATVAFAANNGREVAIKILQDYLRKFYFPTI